MPNRILRASLRQSLRWNQCPLLAQTFYVRLLTLVDDFGRYEAHPQLLANECFPYGDPEGNPVTRAAIAALLVCMCNANLLVCYQIEGNEYLQLTRWKEHVRTKSKFPECPNELLILKCTAVAQQMITSPPTPLPSLSPTPTPSVDSQDSELPARFPKTEEEIKQLASIRAVPEEFAIHCWNKAMGRGGVDSKGMVIKNFGAYLMTEFKYEKDRNGNISNGSFGKPNGAQMVVKGEELKRAESKMQSIRCQYGDHQTWTKEDRDEFNRLKLIRDENRKLLGVRA